MADPTLMATLMGILVTVSCASACCQVGVCSCNRCSTHDENREDPPSSSEMEADPLLVDQDVAGSDSECSICIEGYEYGEQLELLPCGHFYHVSCYEKWDHVSLTGKTTTCPICRRSAQEVG